MNVEGTMTQIRNNLETYNRRVSEILSNRNLSDAGKESALSPLYEEARERHGKLVRELDKARSDERTRLYRLAFAPEGGATAAEKAVVHNAHQGALDRAEAARGDALVALLERTHMIGDDSGALAAASVAYRRGDDKALDRFEELYPAAAEVVRELATFDVMHGTRRDASKKFLDRMLTTGPKVPAGYYRTGGGLRLRSTGR